MTKLYLYGGVAALIAALSYATWHLVNSRAEIAAERDQAIESMEAAQASHRREIVARDSALVVRRWELEQAEQRMIGLRGAINESDEACFDRPVPAAVLERLPN